MSMNLKKTIENNIEYLTDAQKAKAYQVLDSIEKYVLTECVIEKCELLHEIRRVTNIPYSDLQFLLLESERTLMRIAKIHNILPMLCNLYRQKKLTKPIMYSLSKLDDKTQQLLFDSICLRLGEKQFEVLNKYELRNKDKPFEAIVPKTKDLRLSYREFLYLKDGLLEFY